MALLVSGKVIKSFGAPKDASRLSITVPSSYLSEAYGLITGDKILGKIIKVKANFDTSEIESKPIELILKKGAVYDELFISEKSWKESFREYGLVEGGFEIELKLEEATLYTGENIKLYSKRDVKV